MAACKHVALASAVLNDQTNAYCNSSTSLNLMDVLEALGGVFCQDFRLICRLQQLSDSMRASVAATYQGQVHLKVEVQSEDTLSGLAAWISRHGALLASMSISFAHPDADNPPAHLLSLLDTALAAAFQAARHGPAASRPAQLQSITLSRIGNGASLLNELAQLPALSSLSVSFCTMGLSGSAALTASQAMARLTRLQTLRLATDQWDNGYSSEDEENDQAFDGLDNTPLLDLMCYVAIPHLTRLTSLALDGWVGALALQQLPSNLLELHLPPRDVTLMNEPLYLQQLTRLTKLHCGEDIRITSDSVLAPKLLTLTASAGFSCAPLRPLQWLQEIEVSGPSLAKEADALCAFSNSQAKSFEWFNDVIYQGWWRDKTFKAAASKYSHRVVRVMAFSEPVVGNMGFYMIECKDDLLVSSGRAYQHATVPAAAAATSSEEGGQTRGRHISIPSIVLSSILSKEHHPHRQAFYWYSRCPQLHELKQPPHTDPFSRTAITGMPKMLSITVAGKRAWISGVAYSDE